MECVFKTVKPIAAGVKQMGKITGKTFLKGLFACMIICLVVSAANAEISGFKVTPTVLFVKENGALKQVVAALFTYKGTETSGTVKVNIGKDNFSFNVNKLVSGENRVHINISELKKPAKGNFTLAIGKEKSSFAATITPQRKWSVYLFHHSHTDIGYTDLQNRIETRHVAYLDSVIKYCRETDNYPDDAKFRWNVEVTWSLLKYMEQRPESSMKELMDLVKAGRVEIAGWFTNMSDGFSHETLIRNLYLGKYFSDKYGIEITGAMNDDVNGFSWASPQILSSAGIKYFATGINETRSFAPLDRPCAFWWESPDGSKILNWNGECYAFCNYEIQLQESQDISVPRLNTYLTKLQNKPDYPYDITAMNISAWLADNCPPGRNLSDKVREWNDKYAYPKLRLSLMKEFFTDLESQYGKVIPNYKLGWPDYWTDGVGSTSYETGINRNTHNELMNAEKTCSIVSAVDKSFTYPAGELENAYNLSMLYDEHTWGAYNSISEPWCELAKSQWAIKSSYAYIPSEQARTAVKDALSCLAKNIGAKDNWAFAVFNPLSWKRTDIVKITLPGPIVGKNTPFRLKDTRIGAEIPYTKVDASNITFEASDIPSLGYAVYALETGKTPSETKLSTTVQGNSIENKFYRVTLDSKTGGVQSIYDKELGTELVDQSSGYRLDQLIYERPDSGAVAVNDIKKRGTFKRYSPDSAEIFTGSAGPGSATIISRSKTFRFPSIEQKITLYDTIKRIDIANNLDKEETLDAEALYFAFPFNVDKGAFRFEIADATMAPETEQLPKTTRDWQATQNWVEVSNPACSMVWSAIEAPLVEFCDINTGKWQMKLPLINSTFFSYAMNNYWFTNFKASQGGKFTFRYSITSRKGSSDQLASSLFGFECQTPFKTVWMHSDHGNKLPGDSCTFMKASVSNVIIQDFKQAEDGKGYIVRLRELSGKDSQVTLESPLFGGNVKYNLTNIVEKDIPGTSKSGVSVTAPVKAFACQTVRVMF